MKQTKRKAFNFLRSYFDVLNELKTDEDKLGFLMAVINKQFLDEDPEDLSFTVNLCYQSQRHQIESSVKGWKRATKDTLGTNPPTTLGTNPPTNPKEEEEKEEVKEEEKEQYVREFGHLRISLKDYTKLTSEWSTAIVDETLNDIENYPKNTSYKSLYLTALKWLKRKHPIKQQSEATELTELQLWEQAKARRENLKKHF